MSNTSQALAIAGHVAPVLEAVPRAPTRTLDDTFKMASILVKGRLIPKAVTTAEAAFTIILAGAEIGLGPMQALRLIHVIDGKIVMAADLMLALCLRSAKCEMFEMVESTPETATYEAMRVGRRKPTRYSFTFAMAKTAGLTGKDNWRKYPDAMLRARCVTALARMVFPDIVAGLYEYDELGLVVDEDGHAIADRAAVANDVRPASVVMAERPVSENEARFESLRDAILSAERFADLVPLGDTIGAIGLEFEPEARLQAIHDFCEEMMKAQTKAKLKETGLAIPKSGLPEADVLALRGAYERNLGRINDLLAAERATSASGCATPAVVDPVAEDDPESASLRATLLQELAKAKDVQACAVVSLKATERATEGALSPSDAKIVTDATRAHVEQLSRTKTSDPSQPSP